MPEKSVEKSPLLQKLEAAVEGLDMPSETDEPFRVFSLDATEEPEKEKLPALLELKHKKPNSERDVDDFFESAATSEDWMEDEEIATAKRFADLRDLLKQELDAPHVYLFGENEIDVVIIGKAEENYVGLVTLIVET